MCRNVILFVAFRVLRLSMPQHNHERFPTVLEKHPKDSEMHDVAVARNIIDDTFDLTTPGRRSIVIGLAFEALVRVEQHLARVAPNVIRERNRRWTERRVRSIVDGEAVRIDHYEITDLEKMRITEAKNELRKSQLRAGRMAAFLAAQDENFHGDEIERMGAFARGVDLPGVVRSGTDSRATGTTNEGEVAE